MKKLNIIVMALALLVALTQCKKDEQPTSNENNAVSITLDIKGNGGTRMDVNTGTGEVTYEEGDVIYVASGGHYIGTLTHNGTNFGGTITNPTVDEPLHFYFLGNEEPTFNTDNTSCTVSISDQTEHLPVIEYAPSNETYTPSMTTYTSHLLNKCALVKFDVTTVSEAATCITGMKNKVTVDFANNTLTNSKEGQGFIRLAAGSGERWGILLPQESVEAGEEGSAYSEDGNYMGTRGAVPSIYENGYLTVGVQVVVFTEVNPGEAPTGAINGKFTINANGDQVYLSQGNLQYQASTNTWRFAENQWDYVGEANANISQTYDGWIDLFGWGTSGYNHGAVCYQPWSATQTGSYYYAYGNPTYNLYDQTGKADWGYNAISNGGNSENSGWRTLTKNEWIYLIDNRNTGFGIRYAKGCVNGVNGLILLPDDWNNSVYELNNVNGGRYTDNTITADDWTIILEANGAVFLPMTGCRYGTTITGFASYTTNGYYTTSSSYLNNYNYISPITFSSSSVSTTGSSYSRYDGLAVRLVRNVE